MSLCLRIILIIASLFSSFYVVKKIRKSQMKIEAAMYWIFFVILILILSVFPNICYVLARWIGIESPANLIYLLMIFIALGKNFSLSVKNSELEYKVSILAEEMAIWKNQVENSKQKDTVNEK